MKLNKGAWIRKRHTGQREERGEWQLVQCNKAVAILKKADQHHWILFLLRPDSSLTIVPVGCCWGSKPLGGRSFHCEPREISFQSELLSSNTIFMLSAFYISVYLFWGHRLLYKSLAWFIWELFSSPSTKMFFHQYITPFTGLDLQSPKSTKPPQPVRYGFLSDGWGKAFKLGRHLLKRRANSAWHKQMERFRVTPKKNYDVWVCLSSLLPEQKAFQLHSEPNTKMIS